MRTSGGLADVKTLNGLGMVVIRQINLKTQFVGMVIILITTI